MNATTAAAIAAHDAHKAGATLAELAEILAPVGMRAKVRGGHLTITNRPTLGQCIREALARRLG